MAVIQAAAIVIVAGCLLFQTPARAQDQVEQAVPANIGPEAAAILKDGQYQTEIPGGKAGGDATTSTLLDTSPDGAPPALPEIPGVETGVATAGHVIQFIVYALLAGLAILVLVAIFQAYRGSRRREAPETIQALATPLAPQAPRPAAIDRIEELAAAGDFEAAIHLMLLRALAALRMRLGELPDSLTSREILRRSSLPREAAQPLSVIIGAVEVSHFGGQRPNEAVYRLCAERYRQFLGIAA